MRYSSINGTRRHRGPAGAASRQDKDEYSTEKNPLHEIRPFPPPEGGAVTLSCLQYYAGILVEIQLGFLAFVKGGLINRGIW